jgi:hypothetical protein
MKQKITAAIGFMIGLGLAHWIKVLSAQYLWILFYRG